MYDTIEDKRKNIGALCSFLKSSKNKLYLDYIISNTIDISMYDLSLSSLLYYYFNNITYPLLCKCGEHRKYISFSSGFRVSCGDKECYVKYRKETCLLKYGVDNPTKSKIIKEKSKNTILKKYNGKHYMYDDSIRNKFKFTMNDKYGVDWAQQNKIINGKTLKTWNNKSKKLKESIIESRINTFKNKSIAEKNDIVNKRNETIIERYNSLENYYNIIQSKIKITSKIKYSVLHFLKNDEIKRKRVNSYINTIDHKIIKLLSKDYKYLNREYNSNNTDTYINLKHYKCDNKFKITRQLFVKRIKFKEEVCLKCNPLKNGYSKSEKDILKFISDNYVGDILENIIIFGVSCDIYIPKLKLGIEYNGLYWHSELYKDNNFHLNKTLKFIDNNNKLIHIFEDEWLHKCDIVKSNILNLLNISIKIYASECIVKVGNIDNIINFLDTNYIDGYIEFDIGLGLYYNYKLVSVMTFSMCGNNKYELLVYCNILNTTVVGGGYKLFNYFIDNYNTNTTSILCKVDRRWSDGDLFKKLNFKLYKINKPNYYYIDKLNIKRYSDTSNSYKIYDSGSLEYIFISE